MRDRRRLLSTNAAAERLGYAPRTIRLFAQLGVLTPIRVREGGNLRFAEEEIERLAGDERKVAV
jgi:DNA-binding transcriptional MerR regulator